MNPIEQAYREGFEDGHYQGFHEGLPDIRRDGLYANKGYTNPEQHIVDESWSTSTIKAINDEVSNTTPDDLCECGHLRSEHVAGGHYCMKGCYTSEAQADYLRDERGERPICTHFRERLDRRESV